MTGVFTQKAAIREAKRLAGYPGWKEMPPATCRLPGAEHSHLDSGKEQTLSKFTKGRFRMNKEQGLELDGLLSPWLRLCIGLAILFLAASPLAIALKWVRWW